MNVKDIKARAGEVANFLKSMPDQNRLVAPCTVGEMGTAAGIRQSALSQHLATPREAKPVTTRGEAHTIYYRLANRGVQRPIDVLYDLYCRPSRRRRS